MRPFRHIRPLRQFRQFETDNTKVQETKFQDNRGPPLRSWTITAQLNGKACDYHPKTRVREVALYYCVIAPTSVRSCATALRPCASALLAPAYPPWTPPRRATSGPTPFTCTPQCLCDEISQNKSRNQCTEANTRTEPGRVRDTQVTTTSCVLALLPFTTALLHSCATATLRLAYSVRYHYCACRCEPVTVLGQITAWVLPTILNKSYQRVNST